MNEVPATRIQARSRSGSPTTTSEDQEKEEDILRAHAARAALGLPQPTGPPCSIRPTQDSLKTRVRERRSPPTQRTSGLDLGSGPARHRSFSRARTRLGPYQPPEESGEGAEGQSEAEDSRGLLEPDRKRQSMAKLQAMMDAAAAEERAWSNEESGRHLDQVLGRRGGEDDGGAGPPSIYASEEDTEPAGEAAQGPERSSEGDSLEEE